MVYRLSARYDFMVSIQTKQIIRSAIRQGRKKLTFAERCSKALQIHNRLCTLTIYQQAVHIGCYMATTEEVSTKNIIKTAWQDSKQIYLPVITKPRQPAPSWPAQPLLTQPCMQFYCYQQEDGLRSNHLHIMEPLAHAKKPVDALQLDIILVPLVGFDTCGNRLGMGGGYYDRYLPATKARSIGLAYQQQYRDHLPVEPWDIKLDYVITERQIYQF